MNKLEILVLIIAIAQAVGILGVVVAIFYALRIVSKIGRQAQPVLDQVRSLVEHADKVAITVGSRAEDIAATGDQMVHDVSHKVEETVSLVRDAIGIQLTPLGGGISKGLSVWSKLAKTQGGDGHGKSV